MAKTNEAISRLFDNVWICMRCNAKIRVGKGKKPVRCRKCASKRLRLKNKIKKAKA